MKKRPTIAIILGTARKQRKSIHAVTYILKVLKKKYKTHRFTLVDVADYNLGRTTPPWEKGTKTVQKWRRMANNASGFIIVTPEYNHSFPGELKIALDCAYKEYTNKPVILAGVSAGQFGGARVLEHMATPLRELQMRSFKTALYFPNIQEFIDMSSKQKDEAYKERVEKAGKKLISEL